MSSRQFEYPEDLVEWAGPGFYADRQEWGRIRTWPLYTKKLDEANAAAKAGQLGTPYWLFKQQPVQTKQYTAQDEVDG